MTGVHLELEGVIQDRQIFVRKPVKAAKKFQSQIGLRRLSYQDELLSVVLSSQRFYSKMQNTSA